MNEKELSIQNITGIIINPFQKFFKTEASGGILLIIAAFSAISIANSPLGSAYHHFWEIPIGLSVGNFTLEKSMHHWINDGLMAIFFFLVGLELKREILVGELSSIKLAALPISAAIGGMLLPALLFTWFNLGGPGEQGWAIPMATDIAFALGCLALLGNRVPTGILIFMTALAIVDDLGGILVIAVFHTEDISFSSLMFAVVFLSFSFVLNKAGVRKTLPYALIGICLWLALLKSGIHATVAGILLAITIPASTAIKHSQFIKKIEEQLHQLTGRQDGADTCPLDLDEDAKQTAIQAIEKACDDAEAPLEHIEHSLHPWVIFVIMPIFAFANAGVEIKMEGISTILLDPIFLGITVGLFVGKQVGIFLFSWITVKIGLASLPTGVRWIHIYGVSILAGIGFTMSLFIGTLAFDDPLLLETAKLGIIAASTLSGVVGYLVLRANPLIKEAL